MLLSEVLSSKSELILYDVIGTECSTFLSESNGLPVFKTLPSTLIEVNRIKVRYKKDKPDPISNAFAEAIAPKVRQRAVFATGTIPVVNEGEELFYVFPVNEYKYVYSSEVIDSTTEYNKVCESLLAELDEDQAVNVITEMLKISYNSTLLNEGIDSGAEILFYNIPVYYAVKASSIEYKDLIHRITHKK